MFCFKNLYFLYNDNRGIHPYLYDFFATTYIHMCKKKKN